jgi:hypothetical protein
VILADTSGLLALFNSREPAHPAVAALLQEEPGPIVVSPYVIAELDYLAATRLGVSDELAILAELAGGAYLLPQFSADNLSTAIKIIERYGDQQVGLTDASLVVLADHYRTKSVLTLDRRHFEVLRPLSGGRFRILPSNSHIG